MDLLLYMLGLIATVCGGISHDPLLSLILGYTGGLMIGIVAHKHWITR